MEQRTKKPTLTLRKPPTPSSTPNVEANPLADIPDFTYELIPALESSDVDDDYSYYTERKKVRVDKRTHRSEQSRKESRWQ